MDTILNEDMTFVPGALEKLDPTFTGNPTLANTKDIKSLASQLVNSESLLGKKVEALIPNDGKPESYVNFARKFLKAPDKAEGFADLVKPADWPETIPWNDEIMKDFAGQLPQLGLLPWQGKKLFDWYNGVSRKFHETIAAAEKSQFDGATTKLKELHKNNFDKIVQTANAVLNKYAGTEFGPDTAKKYENDPFIINLLANIAGKMGEDFIRLPVPGADETAMADAQKKINTIMGDKTHAYFDKQNPAHDAAIQEVRRLYQILYPERAAV